MLNFGCSLLAASHGEQAGGGGFNYIIIYYILYSHGEQAGKGVFNYTTTTTTSSHGEQAGTRVLNYKSD